MKQNKRFVQIFNPRIKKWMKIDMETGKVVGVKREPYKGVERWENELEQEGEM